MPAITPFLWFNDKAEEATIVRVSRYGDAGPGPKGSPPEGALSAGAGQRPGEVAARHESDAADGEARYREPTAGGKRGVGREVGLSWRSC